MADALQILETRHVALVHSEYANTNLNTNARNILLNRHLNNNSTNRSYHKGQRMFLEWMDAHNISQTDFTPVDLINFLSDMHTAHSYTVLTLQLFRFAVTHLHPDPASLRQNEDVNAFITSLLSQAPPVRLHHPSISLQPTINRLHSLSADSISLALLQQKLAFLLGITCFLRPSDLHCISFSSSELSPDKTLLLFEVHSLKEKRGRRRIVKSFSVKSHSDTIICSVATFIAFKARRPNCTLSTLFVNSLRPDHDLSTRTIQSWLTKLLRLSTAEPRVSIRSIASSIALQSGIPKEDIVTMGNWASSSTFENHYRREHLSTFDFTNTLLSKDFTTDEAGSPDIFFDAEDSLD